MLRTSAMNRICCAATAAALLLSLLLWGWAEPAKESRSHTIGYESLLFDQSTVHTIDIYMEDWDSFIANAMAEEYADCDIVIDGERMNHVAIRAKGNTSLSSVSTLGSTRYSFKVEFDHYVSDMTYHGLDKLSLNNLIQDTTMMKDYLAYTLMNRMDVPSSLCSYVQINVNGEPWGLYLAVEGVEDAFLERNGLTGGELYKPDSMSFGGGRGNGRDFDFSQFSTEEGGASGKAAFEGKAAMPSSEDAESFGGPADDQAFTNPPDSGSAGGFGGFRPDMGNDDVKLIYSDDDPESYSNIFDNAKTDVTDKDKRRLIDSLRRLNAGEDIETVVDTDEVIRYLAVHSFLCNDDSYTGMMVHNYYLYEKDSMLSIIPWDYNLAFGGFSASSDATSTVNSPIDSPVSGGTVDSRPLIAWIFRDEQALSSYHEAYSRFIEENIESGWLAEEIARVQAMIAPYLQEDSSAFYTMDEFNQAVNTLQTFCEKRGLSIRGQLDGAIPSTTQAQSGQRSALVDASDISTSDMGSMNTGGGPGGGFSPPSGGFSPPGEGFSPPDGDSSPPGGMGNPFGRGGMQGQTPGQDSSRMPPTGNAEEQTHAAHPISPQGGFSLEAEAEPGKLWQQALLWMAVLLAALVGIRQAKAHNS